jgi:hypothetical protein
MGKTRVHKLTIYFRGGSTTDFRVTDASVKTFDGKLAQLDVTWAGGYTRKWLYINTGDVSAITTEEV